MKFEHNLINTTHSQVVRNVNFNDTFYKTVFELGGIIAGGFARWAVTQAPKILPNDMDIFCRTIDDFKKLVDYLRIVGKKTFESDFAVSYKIDAYPWIHYKVQLIIPRQEGNIKTYGSPEEIISNFDFTINMVAITADGVTCVEDFYQHINKNLLVFNNIHCPIGILVRIRKYIRKGFTIYINEMIKIFEMWDELNPERKAEIIKVLRNPIEIEDDNKPIFQRSNRENPIFKIFYID